MSGSWMLTDVELPPLDVLARVLVGDDDDEPGYLAADHPLVELGHDLLDVRPDLVVGGDCERAPTLASVQPGGSASTPGGRTEHVEAVFLDAVYIAAGSQRNACTGRRGGAPTR